ncbi:MAG TPA: hypothetical protein VFB68_17885 [Xanthobacteraceae bacterium]|nr:hypothetical protein [Xanthobacteraceae bacterium]
MKHYRQEHYSRQYRQELTLDNALTDPLVRTVMAADGVDPHELNLMLRDIVASLDQAHLQPRNRGSLPATNCA